ncbi:hypothetical protein Tco_1509850 [Tanacetum coccineum]
MSPASRNRLIDQVRCCRLCWATRDANITWNGMFSEESDKIEKYVGGLPDMIQWKCQAAPQWAMYWHYKSDCPELKNQNHGNQAEGTRARGLVHALGGGEADQDLNDMEDDISA